MSAVKSGLSLVLISFSSAFLFAQVPRGKAEIALNGTTVTIDYGRPSMRGRDMLAQAPKGYVWRLGADEATTLTVTGRLVFGNMVVQTGTYTLYADRTSEDGWTLLVNSETGQEEHDRSKDLIGVPLKWEKQAEPAEELSIELQPEKPNGETGILTIRWGKDVLRQRFSLAPPK